jgi:predicted O-methyltransferase YrrM
MRKIEEKQNSCINSYVNENKILEDILKKAKKEKIPVIDKNTGRFLELVCLMSAPCSVLEIGCGIGFSSYFLIKNLKNGKYTGIDLNSERLERAGNFIKNYFPEKKCRLFCGNALKIIPELDEAYDMVFIDGAKFEYPLYIGTVKPKLKTGALIVADNIFYKNKIFNKKISNHDLNSVTGIKKYIEYVTGKPCFKSYFFDVGDGISVTKYLKSS